MILQFLDQLDVWSREGRGRAWGDEGYGPDRCGTDDETPKSLCEGVSLESWRKVCANNLRALGGHGMFWCLMLCEEFLEIV